MFLINRIQLHTFATVEKEDFHMKNKYRNLFLLFGVLAIVVMLCTMDMDYSDIWENLKRVGFWFPVIMLL